MKGSAHSRQPSGKVEHQFRYEKGENSAHGAHEDVVNAEGAGVEDQLGHVDEKGENSGGDGTGSGMFFREGQAEQDAEGDQRQEIQPEGVENDRYILGAGSLHQFKEGSERNDVGKRPGIVGETGRRPHVIDSVDHGGPKQAYEIKDHNDLDRDC